MSRTWRATDYWVDTPYTDEEEPVNPIPYPADMRRAVPAGARTPLRLVSSREPAEDDDQVGAVYGAAYVGLPSSEAEAEGWWG